ncbi:type IV secretory system conjugative DNA transfer family protein [Pseudohalocynthiibacter sp. F2068]|uniref:type IV secretory system conjugative DNA transfer family protein n=1 Tax=Pseudohalocynthiibacter sp. F2068 TaxID=2926418 RepID=UPI001FF0F6B0|nr:type IV secretory system conjugative DNA transfer family protein [Pseudohalocynthiibacter sp. F2068]MCK0103219.1 type IV secretory system conjugative DNA transfer family protein [Pseudohalocynthiibacter sp. F2068]
MMDRDPFYAIGEIIIYLMLLSLILSLAFLMTPLFLIAVPVWAGYRLLRHSPLLAEISARRETMALYRHARRGRDRLSDAEIETALASSFPPDVPESLRIQLIEVGKAIFADEGLSPEIPRPPALHNTVEAARYRDQLARIGQARGDRNMSLTALKIISQALAPIANAVPPIEGDVLVGVTQFTHPLGQAIQNVIAPFFQDNDYTLFKGLKERLGANLTATHRTSPVYPVDFKGDDVVETYLRGTYLKEIFKLKTPFAIPEERRFEHTHIVAGSGHGKTQTLQYFIAKDLEDVARGDKSVVVIDSQGDLINTILKAKTLPPEQIVLIDPEDIAYPVSLNLFSVGQDRLNSYNDLERERLTNSIIELYDFVLGSLLSAGMTAKQSVVFRYVTRLMFHIPDATIHTLRELMEAGGTDKYRDHIAKLDGTPRRFFETEFDSKEFTNTKTQVLRRLYGVLENQTFERMFTNPQSKFDMFTELNAGKLILVNTSKSLLKEQGTEIFGRFFIALIAQAAQERATLPARDRLPAMVYIDEAQDYFDQNIGIILSQARKFRVGMIMAHQYLGQLSNGLQEAFEANTSIKLAGGVSARDARALAGQMSADADLIQRQPKGTFATFVRGLTERAVPISFPFFVMEELPRATKEEIAAIKAHSRSAYAEPWQRKVEDSDTSSDGPPKPPEKNDPEDPTNPSPEL